MSKITKWVQAHEWVVVVSLVLLFVLIRLPGLSQPLHQDEYKWPMIANPATAGSDSIPHPPLSELIYRVAGMVVGYNIHFRLVPLFFGALNVFLLYYLLRTRFGKKEALIGSTLFTLSYFSILASLMVDVDGQILPFLFLMVLICYYKTKTSVDRKRVIWFVSLAVIMSIGLFIKLSFILVTASIIADFILENYKRIEKRKLFLYAGYVVGFFVFLAVLLLLSSKIFTFFNLTQFIQYSEHFVHGSRNWFQTAIQVVKVILYASPFLILTPFLLRRDDVKKLRLLILFLLCAFIFFILLFDFSIGALDRYLQLIIVPLCALSAVAVAKILDFADMRGNIRWLVGGLILAIDIFLTSFLPQSVPSLYPKSAWISRVLSLHWNFLYPFSGGSGPLGFYISFLFLGLSWITAGIFFVIALYRSDMRKKCLIAIACISLVYTATFAEEYLFGFINGSASRLLPPAVAFIQNDPKISQVVVYNDNGGYDIQQTGKYLKRLYTSPDFDINQKIIGLNANKVFYFELNIPRIDPASAYRKYLDSCNVVYSQTDHYISALVYDCTKAPNVTN